MSLAILFLFSCAQYISDVNMSIIRSLRLFLLNYHIGRIAHRTKSKLAFYSSSIKMMQVQYLEFRDYAELPKNSDGMK